MLAYVVASYICWSTFLSVTRQKFPSNRCGVIMQTKPVGFSNDFMVATAGHPFLAQMVAALPKWNRRFGSKYPTVMFSTGPMFVSYQVGWPPWRQPLCFHCITCGGLILVLCQSAVHRAKLPAALTSAGVVVHRHRTIRSSQNCLCFPNACTASTHHAKRYVLKRHSRCAVQCASRLCVQCMLRIASWWW